GGAGEVAVVAGPVDLIVQSPEERLRGRPGGEMAATGRGVAEGPDRNLSGHLVARAPLAALARQPRVAGALEIRAKLPRRRADRVDGAPLGARERDPGDQGPGSHPTPVGIGAGDLTADEIVGQGGPVVAVVLGPDDLPRRAEPDRDRDEDCPD